MGSCLSKYLRSVGAEMDEEDSAQSMFRPSFSINDCITVFLRFLRNTVSNQILNDKEQWEKYGADLEQFLGERVDDIVRVTRVKF